MSVLTTANPRMSSRVASRGVLPERRLNGAVCAAPALHQEITVPFLRHREREADPELLAADSGAAIDDAFDAAMGRKRFAATLPVRVRLSGSRRNGRSFGDFDRGDLDGGETRA